MASRWRFPLFAAFLATGCQVNPGADDPTPGDEEPPPPAWHITPVNHSLGDHVLNDIWGDSIGNIYVVGQYGFIMTNRNELGQPGDRWRQMASPTKSHLTAIIGVSTGRAFGLQGNDGDMFAVGWQGTVLHYHPNPDGDPQTEDGRWSLVAGPEGTSLINVTRVDPACPDWDGDGVADDGDGSGFAGDALCVGGVNTSCDDNCRKTANGPMRPLVDLTDPCPDPDNPECGCIGPDDGPHPDVNRYQRDADSDGRGEVCDDDEETPTEAARFDTALFDLFAERYDVGGELMVRVVAVGGDGALVTFDGPSAGETASVLPPVTDPVSWVAQAGATYRFDNDCDAATAPGQVCAGAGRFPASCPAQCHPRRTDCVCPVDQGQCCDDGVGLTGVGCSDSSCPPAPNACNAATGDCSSLCPACFRRQERTLRSVARGANYLVAVGVDGRILVRDDPTDPAGLWIAPTCVTTPEPLDEGPLLASVSARNNGDTFAVVGAAGAMMLIDPSAGMCTAREEGVPLTGGLLVETRLGIPSAFLASVYATSPTQAFVVGDQGLLLQIGGVFQVTEIETGVKENLHTVVVLGDPETGEPILWMVGAGGVFLRGAYY